jgi:hypothetical protein
MFLARPRSIPWPASLRRDTLPVLLAFLVVQTSSTSSLADDKEDCLAAAEQGQSVRDAGKYVQARERFRTCSQASCPVVVRRDCLRWNSDLDDQMPTVVVVARDARGADLSHVRVLVDGVAVADSLDGQPLAVDPGEHTVRFESAGAAPLEERVVVHAGEKNRLLRVELISANRPDAPREVPPEPRPAPATPSPSLGPALVAGGVGVLGFGAMAYFGVKAKSDTDDLRQQPCAATQTCSVSSIRTEVVAANVFLGIGVVGVGVATWLFLTAHSAPAPARSAVALQLGASPTPGGGVLGVAGDF